MLRLVRSCVNAYISYLVLHVCVYGATRPLLFTYMVSLKMFALMLLKPIGSVDLNYKYITISNIYLLYLISFMNFKKN